MLRIIFSFIFLIFTSISFSQDIRSKLQKAYQQFEADSQLRHAISSLYVIDAKSGEVIFDKHSMIGLAPASTQKIITSITALELLGKDFRYKTEFWEGASALNPGTSVIFINGSGDPTFGSPRYAATNSKIILNRINEELQKVKSRSKRLFFQCNVNGFPRQHIPSGWIWEDIGNYYGAASNVFNWKENQTDVILEAGDKPGDHVKVVGIDSLAGVGMILNELKTGPKNSGDNAYYYFAFSNHGVANPILRGTIPAGEKKFPISIAVAQPFSYFINDVTKNKTGHLSATFMEIPGVEALTQGPKDKLLFTHYSPTLDSIIYWFNKKSVNLYGEALVKTIAFEKQGYGSTDSGVAILRKFWKEKGIDEDELNMSDGSGLSPLNRVTTHAQVEILKFAKNRDWYQSFYNALPIYNEMHMKSGTISDVKGFCGYHTSKDGKEYIFSFLVNNYSGRSSAVVQKMYKVLDVLK